jgi:hypothetical protein
MELTLADIYSHLSERGRVEVELASHKAALARQGDVIATLTAALGEKEPCERTETPPT